MSFFILENHTDKDVVVLCCTGRENIEKHQAVLVEVLDGTFYSNFETEKGTYPTWIFDKSKLPEIEKFLEDADEMESILSLPDMESIIDELCRRLERVESKLEELSVKRQEAPSTKHRR